MTRAVRALFATLIFMFPLGLQPAAPAAAPTGKGVVHVGLLTPATGPYAALGDQIASGFRYFLATHGDRLGGFGVDLNAGDEGASPQTSVATARQLVEENAVDVIVGVVNTDDAIAIADYLAGKAKPMLVAGAGADDLTQAKATKTLFRVSHTSSQDTMPLGDYACRRLQLRKIAILAVDYAYGWESAGGFARAYTDAGCHIAQEQYVATDGGDWVAAVGKIDRNAAAVFAAADTPNAAKLLAAYRDANIRVPLLGVGSLTDESLFPLEREGALGVVTGLHYAPTLPGPVNTAFRNGYESLGGKPVTREVENGYVAAQVLDAALGHVAQGPISSDALAAALRNVSVDAPRGSVRFDALGQVVNAVYVRRVRQIGGRLRNEVIATYPAVSQFWHYDQTHYLALPAYAKLKGTWAAH